MFVIDDTALIRYAAQRYLEGRPMESLADWAAPRRWSILRPRASDCGR